MRPERGACLVLLERAELRAAKIAVSTTYSSRFAVHLPCSTASDDLTSPDTRDLGGGYKRRARRLPAISGVFIPDDSELLRKLGERLHGLRDVGHGDDAETGRVLPRLGSVFDRNEERVDARGPRADRLLLDAADLRARSRRVRARRWRRSCFRGRRPSRASPSRRARRPGPPTVLRCCLRRWTRQSAAGCRQRAPPARRSPTVWGPPGWRRSRDGPSAALRRDATST